MAVTAEKLTFQIDLKNAEKTRTGIKSVENNIIDLNEVAKNNQLITKNLNNVYKQQEMALKTINQGVYAQVAANKRLSKQMQQNVKDINDVNAGYEDYGKNINIVVKNAGLTAKQLENVTLKTDEQTRGWDFLTLAVKASGAVVTGYQNAISTVAFAMQGLSAAIRIIIDLTSPANIAKITMFLSAIKMLAHYKGFHALADNIDFVSEKIAYMAGRIFGLGESAEQMMRTINDLTGTIVGGLTKAVTIGSISINGFKVIIAGLITYKTIDLLNRYTSIFNGLKKSVTPAAKSVADFGEQLNKKMQPSLKNTASLGKAIADVFKPSFLNFLKFSALLSVGLDKLAASMDISESSSVRLAGKLVKLTAIIVGGLASAVSFITGQFGKFLVTIGEKMVKASDDMKEHMENAEVSLNNFIFVMQRLNNEFGEAQAGNMQKWQKVINDITSETLYSSDELHKAIKLLVLDTSRLGLTYEQNEKLIRQSVNLATSSGRTLEETIGSIISGLNGSAISLQNLGFDISATGLAHSKLTDEIGLQVQQMNEHEIVMLRANELIKQLSILDGIAATQKDTLRGKQKELNNELKIAGEIFNGSTENLQSLIDVQIRAVRLFNNMPKSIQYAVSSLKDLIGVSLIVIGTTLQYTFKILALLGAIKILVAAINLLTGATISYAAVLKTLFLRIGLISGAVFAFIKTMEYLAQTNEGVAATLKAIGTSLGLVSDQASDSTEKIGLLGKILQGLGQIIKVSVEAPLAGVLLLINQIAAGAIQGAMALNKLFGKDENVEVYQLMLQEVEGRMASLVKLTEPLQKLFTNLFGADQAFADPLKEASEPEAKKNRQKFKQDVEKIAQLINKGFDLSKEKIKLFGSEIAQASAQVEILKTALEASFNATGSREQVAEKVAKTQRDLAKAQLQLEQVKIKKLQEIDEKTQEYYIDSLKKNEQLVEAARLEGEERIKQFDLSFAELKKYTNLSKSEIKKLENYRLQLIKNNEIAISEALSETLKKQFDSIPKLEDLQKQLLETQSKRNENVNYELNLMIEQIAATRAQIQQNKILSEERRQSLIDELNARKQIIEKIKEANKANINIDSARAIEAETRLIIASNNKMAMTERQNILANHQEKMRLISEQISESKKINDGVLPENLAQKFKEQIEAADIALEVELKRAPSDVESEFNKGGDILSQAMSGALQGIDGAMGGVLSAIAGPLAAVLKAPEFLDAISSFIDSITELPTKLLESIGKLINSIMRFLIELPKTLSKLLKELPAMLIDFIKEVPGLIVGFVSEINAVILNLVESLPDILMELIPALITAMPKIALGLIKFLIADAPKIAFKIVKVMIEELPRAIVEGIVDGIIESFQLLGDLFQGKLDFGKAANNITNQVEQMIDKVTTSTSRLFNVDDITAKAQVLEPEKLADEFVKAVLKKTSWAKKIGGWIADYFKDGINKLTDWFKEKGGHIAEGFKQFMGGFSQFGKKIWEGLQSAAENIGDWGVKIWNQLVLAGEQIGGWGAKIWNGFLSAAATIGDWGTQIWKGLTQAFNDAGSFFEDIGGKIWGGLKSGLDTLGSFFKDLFDKLNPSNLFEKIFQIDYKGQGKVEKALGIDVPFAKFAQGGIIPGQAVVAGDSEINDRILALLSPGEAVIPRTKMQDPNVSRVVQSILNGSYKPEKFFNGGIKGFIQQFNPWDEVKKRFFDNFMEVFSYNSKNFYQGGVVRTENTGFNPAPAFASMSIQPSFTAMPSMGSKTTVTENYQISPTIIIENKGKPIDALMVKNAIMPTVEKELRRLSQSGKFVISNRGIRNA